MRIGPFGWLTRKKKSLGVAFFDMVTHSQPKKRKTAKIDPSWQEVFLPTTPTKYQNEKIINPWAKVVMGLVVTAAFLVIGGQLWNLEVVNGKQSLALSNENRVRIISIPAPRGIIYDRNGQILVTNVPGFRLVANTTGLSSTRLNQISDKLAELLGVPSAQIRKKISDQSQNEIVIQSGISRDQALDLEVRLTSIPEVRVDEEPIRSYPNGSTLGHLLGYVGEISPDELKQPEFAGVTPGTNIGRSGIEQSYDYLLRGKDGRQLVEVDSLGKTARVIATEDPVPGNNLILTVDLGLTKQTEQALQKQLAITQTRKAAVIALNPQDGSVLTYLSYPEFDPNLFSNGISTANYQNLINDPDQPLFDRVLSGTYPPGSTFKPTVAVAALSEGVTTKDRLIDSPPVIYLGTQAFHNWATYSLGQQSLIDAIAYSNDIYFYNMGGDLGVDRLSSWAAKFGFGQKTGINLAGEASGNLPTAAWKLTTTGQPWYPGDNYNLGIGQGFLLATPIQLADDMAAIGNGGRLYQPILVKEVRDQNNLVISRDTPVLRRGDLAKTEVIDLVKQGMKKACTVFVSFGGDTGCKTGTAEFGGSGQNPHGWFGIFAPYNNPQQVMIVLLEGVGHGSIYSSPVAKPSFGQYLTQK